MFEFHHVAFVDSVYSSKQLPAETLPEIAFAGRSNVGKSSLINKLINRKNLVKVSAKPGKTQSINFFLADDNLYLVDLPGYGFAKVPRQLKQHWQDLISSYIEGRSALCCVVVILDIRHALKTSDFDLVTWLRSIQVPYLPVYTKVDKLKRNQRGKQARALDAALGVDKEERVLFSAKTGEGKDDLIKCLEKFLVKR